MTRPLINSSLRTRYPVSRRHVAAAALTVLALGAAGMAPRSASAAPVGEGSEAPAVSQTVGEPASANERGCTTAVAVTPEQSQACTHGGDPVTPHRGEPPARDRSNPSTTEPFPESDEPTTAEGYASSSGLANYGTGSIRCSSGAAGNNNDKRFVAIYAVANNNPNKRYSTMAPKLRQAIYNASGYMDDEAGSAAQRMRVLCPPGSAVPTVFDISNLAVDDNNDSFAAITAALRARNFIHSNEKYIVFYDGYVNGSDGKPIGGEGQIHLDSAPTSANLNNTAAAMYAIDYSDPGLPAPDWQDTLHEMGHTMGAVQKNSPNSNGHLHCKDETDIMCYAEHDVQTFSSCGLSPKGFERFDCRWNDYFGPFPAAGSYLTTNWNIAGGYNAYVHHTAD